MACMMSPVTIALPDMGSNVGADAYRRKLRLLLRVGDLWELNPGGVFDKLLRAMAEEYSRLHFAVCRQTEDAPLQVGALHSWSLRDYRELLANYGIDAEVTDHQCDILTVDNATADSRVWHVRFGYFIIITVPRLADVPAAIHACLAEYRQSHTALMWRQHPHWETRWDIEPLTVDNATADSVLYTDYFHAVDIHAHPSYTPMEMHPHLTGLKTRTIEYQTTGVDVDVLYDHAALTVDNATAASVLYAQDWHALNVTLPAGYPETVMADQSALIGIRPYTTVTLSRDAATITRNTIIQYHWEELPHAPY